MWKSKICWQDFEFASNNVTVDFEDMSRIIFKKHYLKDIDINLIQSTNNAGIETEPYTIDGERLGFQAKYFSNDVSYNSIIDSMEKTIKTYNGRIDKVIFFCNKNLTPSCNSYNKIVDILSKANIEFETFCNDSILDLINHSEDYNTIKALYFNKFSLNREWFDKLLEDSLVRLNPRYVKGFHVKDQNLENYFDLIYDHEQVLANINKRIKTWKKQLEKIYKIDDKLINKIKEKINNLIIPTWGNINDIFNWHKLFINEKTELEKLIEQTESKIYSINTEKEKVDYSELRNIVYHANKLKDIIDDIYLEKDDCLQYVNSKIFILEGKAGVGKSHILGYEAELHSTDRKNRIVFLPGQLLIKNANPQEQILEYLGLQNINLDTFLDACEGLGELDGTNTIINIDAVNECVNYDSWKNFLPKLFNKILRYKFIKLVVSIRETYKEQLFESTILDKINSKEIGLIEHVGFEKIALTAIPQFFDYYHVPLHASMYLKQEFRNPLFLYIYCKAYDNKMSSYDNHDMFYWYHRFMQQEEEKIKQSNGIKNMYNYTEKILEIIGNYFTKYNIRYIPMNKLYELSSNLPKNEEIITGFINSNLLVSYWSDNEEILYVCYEKLADYIVANQIIKTYEKLGDLHSYIVEKFFMYSKNNRLLNHKNIGVFAILGMFAKKIFNVEIISWVIDLNEKGLISNYDLKCIVNEYIDAYKLRPNEYIDKESYCKLIMPIITNNDTYEHHIDLLINLAGQNNSMNADFLSDWLSKITISQRDYSWTIMINGKYNKGDDLYTIIQFFLSNNYVGKEERKLYAKLLSWCLTSSNRKLRDNASRALINLLDNDYDLMTNLLNYYINIDDTYIISRLFGCVYGALLRINKYNLNKEKLNELANNIYSMVFNQGQVYPDVLLRDYARNIIEYALYINGKVDFDINKCRPPYNSKQIPIITISTLKELYPDKHNIYNKGTQYIKMSMAPEDNIDGFSLSYGDFGRYVFGRALSSFNISTDEYNIIYSYAYKYIIKDLGYTDAMFSDYDSNIGYSRFRSANYMERIGKKYEWIAMYHTLALVIDNYSYRQEYNYTNSHCYQGTWSPYVRDFDPSLSIMSMKQRRDIGIALNYKNYDNWNLQDPNWSRNIDGMFNFKELVKLSDQFNDEWICLYFNRTDKSNIEDDFYKYPYQDIWKSLSACLISKDDVKIFIDAMHDKNFWGRWLRAEEGVEEYTIFSKEYCWSPAYLDQFPKDEFDWADLEGTHICKIAPTFSIFRWEEEYDFSKDDTIIYRIPSNYIISKFQLEQKNDGVWYENDKIVCVDFSLIEGSNVDGLYIRKEYIDNIIDNTDYELIWIGIGEKNEYNLAKNRYSNLSSLIYRDKQKYIEINHVDER